MAFKNRLSGVARQAKTALSTHQDSIERGIDKAGELANQKTGAKHGQRIRKGSRHLRTGLGKITRNPSTRDRRDDDGDDGLAGAGHP